MASRLAAVPQLTAERESVSLQDWRLMGGLGQTLHLGDRRRKAHWHLRQDAAQRGEADTWLKLDARRQRQSTWARLSSRLIRVRPLEPHARPAPVSISCSTAVRTSMDADQRTWKACWVHTLTSSNLVSSATLSSTNEGRFRASRPCPRRHQATSAISSSGADRDDSVRMRGIGDGSSHRQHSAPPSAAISRVGRRPSQLPSRPPTAAPSGRAP